MSPEFTAIVDKIFQLSVKALLSKECLAAAGIAVASSLGLILRSLRYQNKIEEEWYQNKVVFITGCDSGLGFSFANHCHSLGMVVVAACHTANSTQGAQELEKLTSTQRMFVIRNFDVCDKKCIQSAKVLIESVLNETSASLWAVVNNAAMLVLGKLEWLTDSMIESHVQVNLLGPIHICRAFLPLLNRTKGSRIISITSASAETRLPMASVYAATKAGLEAVSDSLRVEASTKNIKMILLDPGEILNLTPFASRQAVHYKEMEEEMSGSLSKSELPVFNKFSNIFSNHLPKPAHGMIIENRIYRLFDAALTSRDPKRRYSAATWMERLSELYMIWAPTSCSDVYKRRLLQM